MTLEGVACGAEIAKVNNNNLVNAGPCTRYVLRSLRVYEMASRGKHSTLTPSSNRLLEQKWNGMRYQSHKDRIRKIKPTVDCGKPKEFTHIKQKAKKAQMEYEKWRTIDKHNQELLGRMEHIMQTRGRVDHINNYQSKPCLHHFVRQQEAERVHRENLGLLKRLQTVKPMYRTDVWESDFKTHEERKNNISLFPSVKGHTWQGKYSRNSTTRSTNDSEEEIEVAEELNDDVHLPPIVEEKSRDRMPSQLAKSIMAARERERSKSPEEIIEIMN